MIDVHGMPVADCGVMPRGYFADVAEMDIRTSNNGTFQWVNLFHPGLFIMTATRHSEPRLYGQTSLTYLTESTHFEIMVHSVTEEQLVLLRR